MPGMTSSPGEATGTDGTEGTDRPQPKRQSKPRSRQDKFDKLEERLTEMLAGIAVGQAGLGLIDGNQAHMAGANVTSELGPQLAGAWVSLARENPRVETILSRMTEGSAWGQVFLATAGFAYSQAQAYGAVPPTMPNPWLGQPPIVPPSPDVAAAEQDPPSPTWDDAPVDVAPPAAPADNGEAPVAGRQPPQGLGPPDVREKAEAQRRAAEAQRLRQARGQ